MYRTCSSSHSPCITLTKLTYTAGSNEASDFERLAFIRDLM